MKKILVLGGSYLQSDFVEVALKEGHEVHVLDRNPECYLANRENIIFKVIDIANVDIVDEYFVSYGCDILLSPITEIGNRVASVVAAKNKVAYNSVETVKATTNKALMRMRLKNTELLEPRVINVESIDGLNKEEIKYPVIVKPAVSSASRGVTLVNSSEDLRYALERALLYCSKGSGILIEEYIGGEQYSIETISSHGKHHVVAIVKEELSGAPYYMERNDVIDVQKNIQLLPHIQVFINELLNSVGVTIGPCHTEVKIDANNNIRLIEIASRSGLLRDRLIRTANGEEYNKLILDSYLGLEIERVALPKTNALLGIIAYQSDLDVYENALKQNLVFDSHISGFELVEKPTMLTDAVGYYFIRSTELQIFNNFKVKL